MYLQKNLKNICPTVWHLDFAILLTWQKERKDWHICQTCSHLALENWREVINAKPLEIASFHLCHIFFETWQTPSFVKPIMQNGWGCSKLMIRHSL